MEPKMVYMLVDRATGKFVGSYSRAHHDVYEFASAQSARSANVHGIFEDEGKYAVACYRVTYELVDPDAAA